MKINSIEKILIGVLIGIAIFIASFYFLIKPEMSDLSKARASYQKASDQLEQEKNNSANVATLKMSNDKLQLTIQNNAQPFFPELKSDKLQIFFQNLASKVGVAYTGITISDVSVTQVDVSSDSSDSNNKTIVNYPAKIAGKEIQGQKVIVENKNTNSSSSSSNSSSAKNDNAPDLVELSTVVVTIKNPSKKQITDFVDAVNASGRIARITNVSETSDEKNSLTANITVECYGIYKYFSGDALQVDSLATP